MGVLQGKLLAVSANGTVIDCQTDATLNIAVATEESDPCKPVAGEASNDASWADPTEGAKSWTLDFSAKSFAKSTGFNQADLIDLLVNGSSIVEVQFATTETLDFDLENDEIQVFSGTGILNNFNLNAPAVGESTYDATVTGKGKPTFVRTPITT